MLDTNDTYNNNNNNIEEDKVIKKVIMAKGKKKNDNKWKGKAIRDTEGLKAYNRSMGKSIGIRREEFDEIIKQCQKRETDYPPKGLVELFKEVLEGLEVRESLSAAWCESKVRGLFLKAGSKMREGVIIGIYGGKITITSSKVKNK